MRVKRCCTILLYIHTSAKSGVEADHRQTQKRESDRFPLASQMIGDIYDHPLKAQLAPTIEQRCP
jgi:hypothetical protein